MKVNSTKIKLMMRLYPIIFPMIALMTSAVAFAADPAVISVSPANGASGVSINTQVAVVFNDDMNAATINSSTFQVRASGGNVLTGTIDYDVALRKATFTPSSALNNSTTYKVTIKGGGDGVKSIGGKQMKKDFHSSFTTAPGPDQTAPRIKNVSPEDGDAGVSLTTNVTAKFTEDMNGSTINGSTFELRDAANQLVPATVSYHNPPRKATLTPLAPLTYSTVYTAKVFGGNAGVKDLSGNGMAADYTWSFSTPYTIFQPTEVPTTPVTTDAPVEVGVRFTTTEDGNILGLRFFKGAGNDGTHIGHLWNSTGTMLAEATFTNETASGWQEVSFSVPVGVTAGQTYTASYFSSLGKYGFTNFYFITSVVNGPIRALSNAEAGGNGVYAYSGAPVFPTSSFNATNYYVDVVFAPNSDGNRLYTENNAITSGNIAASATGEVKNSTTSIEQTARIKGATGLALGVSAMPNPSTDNFNIVINSNDANPVMVRVHDLSGRLIFEKLTSAGSMRIGQSWKPGVYIAEVMQGNQRRLVKIIKAN